MISFTPFLSYAEMGVGGNYCDLLHDLMTVDQVNQSLCDRFPIYNNHLLYGGYLNMPSARMRREGECGAGFSYVPPYRNYNLRLQLFTNIEISGNYRVFGGVDDEILTPLGFGDKSDKGVNVKLAILRPEDTYYLLPGIAIGMEDFLGTKSFEASYAVATYIIPQWNLEMSVGYGQKRIQRWFGGVTWVPFRKSCSPFLRNFAFVGEYDATPYGSDKWEPHPEGRTRSSYINFGVKNRLWDALDLSLSYVRGEKLACSASLDYNFGYTEGFLPKTKNPLPYRAPRNLEPLGPLRPSDVFVQELYSPFYEQGFDLRQVWLSTDCCGQRLIRLKIKNCTYRYEREVRDRLNDLLAALVPSDVDRVIVVVEDQGLALQEYHYPMKFVRMYADRKVCPYELFVLSPLRDVTRTHCGADLLFCDRPELISFDLCPRSYTMFGSAKGKFKYALGVSLGMTGTLWKNITYNVVFGYNACSRLYDVKDVDRLNPSQIINVRTDTVNYFKEEGFTVDEAYLEKSFNLGSGFYGRAAGGLFEIAYGGGAAELLYYPIDATFAVGIEAAYLRKRTYTGVGFTNEIRKLEGWTPTYQKFYGSQYFFNAYKHVCECDVDIHVKVGQFLAKDFGVRTELARTYPSGFRVFAWYTNTDAKDYVNGDRYFDKGVGFSMPLDIFYSHSSKRRLVYGMSAWLRDVGAIACTGNPLYLLIRDSREN